MSPSALVTGGASGLGYATATRLLKNGFSVVVGDLPQAAANAPTNATFVACDVTVDDQVDALVNVAASLGPLQVIVNCAGIAPASKICGRKGLHPLALFEKALTINVTGSFNVIRYAVAAMQKQPPINDDGERGVIVNTASVAAFDGQIGQAAYAASKGAVAAMTLPLARELASDGIRVMTIAPGIFSTPMLQAMPKQVQDALATMVPFPKRLGLADEYAQLVEQIVANHMLNGEVIRLDGAIRMQPK